ncbi:hypothetical protein Peur_033745 [Populus x canadensis]
MHRTKSIAHRSRMVAASSSSSEDDISLGASQEEAPAPPAPSIDAASSSVVSQRRGNVPSFTNIEVARVISSTFKSSMEILLFHWSQVSRHPEWIPQINAWFDRFKVDKFDWDSAHDTVVRRVWENHAATRQHRKQYKIFLEKNLCFKI